MASGCREEAKQCGPCLSSLGEGFPEVQLVIRNILILLKLRFAGGRGYSGVRVCCAPCNLGVK